MMPQNRQILFSLESYASRSNHTSNVADKIEEIFDLAKSTNSSILGSIGMEREQFGRKSANDLVNTIKKMGVKILHYNQTGINDEKIQIIVTNNRKSIKKIEEKYHSNQLDKQINLILREKEMEADITTELTGVVQINCGKSHSATEEIGRKAEAGEAKIVLIQEPSGYNKTIRQIKGGIIFAHECPEDRARACVWVEKGLAEDYKCVLLQQLSDRDHATILLEIKRHNKITKTVICSAYFPHLNSRKKIIKNPISANIHNIVKYCKDNKAELLIGADANAHSEVWGDKQTDIRGNNILDYLLKTDLTICNNGSLATFTKANTFIDITFASLQMELKISDWIVDPRDSASDHRAIHFKIDLKETKGPSRKSKKKTDWKKFEKIINKHISSTPVNKEEIDNCEQLDEEADELGRCLHEAFQRSCKSSERKTNFYRGWYTAELREERSEVIKKYQKIPPHKSQYTAAEIEQMNDYKTAKNTYYDNCRKTKKLNWQQSMTKIENIKDTARLQKLLEKEMSGKIGTLKKADGSYTNSLEESAKLLMETHHPDCTRLTNELPPAHTNLHLEVPQDKVEIITETYKIEWAIDELGSFKAPGEDEIFPAMLKKSKKVIIPVLHRLFQSSLKLTHVPKAWRGTIITFIPKNGKKAYDTPDAFRPISLMSFLLKILEKLIDKYLRENGVENRLSDAQHAYRKSRGTDSAHHALCSHIDKAINYNEIAIATFVDIKGAFDFTRFETIREAAIDFGIEEWIIAWIENMLKTRTIKAALGEAEIKYNATRGCPQGGCLSPLLWSMVVNSLLERLIEAGFTVVGYADDAVILRFGGRRLELTLCELMNEALKIVEKWCHEKGLSVNPDKSQLIRFSKGIQTSKLKPIRMYGKEITRVKQTKYLGLTIDENLNWGKHIDNVVQKAKNSLWASRAMISKNWGLNPKAVLWLYKQVIMPRITFGCLAWWHAAVQVKANQMKLSTIQRTAMLMATGATSYTATESLNAILDLPPLHIKIEHSALKTCIRLVQNSLWLMDKNYTLGHRKIILVASALNIPNQTDEIRGEWITTKKFSIKINEHANWSYSVPIKGNSKVWYTITHKKRNSTVFGCVLISTRQEIARKLNANCPENMAAISAIEACARASLDAKAVNQKITILTELKCSLIQISNNLIRSQAIKNCITTLNELGNHNVVTLAWCPKNKDEDAKKQALTLANSRINLANPDITIPVSSDIIKESIEDIERNRALEHWNKNKKEFLHSCRYIAGYETEKAKALINRPRMEIRAIIGFLTGCTCLKNFLYKIGKANSDNCRLCNESTETMNHIANHCNTATNIFKNLPRTTDATPDTLNIDYNQIIAFLKAVNIYEALTSFVPICSATHRDQ